MWLLMITLDSRGLKHCMIEGKVANGVQDTKVEWECLREGAPGVLTKWLGGREACPMVVEHTLR